jgi:hypothetical protein
VFDPGTVHEVQRVLPLLVDEPSVWSERWLAGSLPVWPRVNLVHGLYQPRNLDDNGRLFFDSAPGLVPQDSNGKEDVYEYEPEGAGPESARCAPSVGVQGREAYRPARTFEAGGARGEEGAGCVGLISSGASGEESAFMDASAVGPGGEEGEDVFFMTSAQLAPSDLDNARDVYDAHQCSSAQPCAPEALDVPPACTGTESCRSAPAPQPEVYGPPASATFNGPGNISPPPPAAVKTVKKKTVKCAKGKTRNKKGRCVKKKIKKRAKRASRNRRTKA